MEQILQLEVYLLLEVAVEQDLIMDLKQDNQAVLVEDLLFIVHLPLNQQQVMQEVIHHQKETLVEKEIQHLVMQVEVAVELVQLEEMQLLLMEEMVGLELILPLYLLQHMQEEVGQEFGLVVDPLQQMLVLVVQVEVVLEQVLLLQQQDQLIQVEVVEDLVHQVQAQAEPAVQVSLS
jgi:hypothetical protein